MPKTQQLNTEIVYSSSRITAGLKHAAAQWWVDFWAVPGSVCAIISSRTTEEKNCLDVRMIKKQSCWLMPTDLTFYSNTQTNTARFWSKVSKIVFVNTLRSQKCPNRSEISPEVENTNDRFSWYWQNIQPLLYQSIHCFVQSLVRCSLLMTAHIKQHGLKALWCTWCCSAPPPTISWSRHPMWRINTPKTNCTDFLDTQAAAVSLSWPLTFCYWPRAGLKPSSARCWRWFLKGVEVCFGDM